MSETVRPWYNAARVTVPTGVVVPDLTVKRSLVLAQWNAQRQRARGDATQRQRLQAQARAYEGASVDRLAGDWFAMGTSADSELLTSLRILRNRARQLVRDNPYARQAVRLLMNNVVGTGIGLQAQVVNTRGKLQSAINTSIEQAFADWSQADTCHTAGVMGLAEIERMAVAAVATAGEVIIRLVRQPFGRRGRIPLALEVIEADRLMDQWQTARAPNGNAIRMGVEVDDWGRPVAYWFLPRHPGDYQFATFDPAKYVRVEAQDVLHLYIVERWPQTRGESWFSSTLRTVRDVGQYEDATLIKARASANIVGFIKSPEPVAADATEGGRRILETEPGTWQTLLPGEDVAGFNATAPSPELEPFLRHMVRKQAVGVGISYEAYSRDYTGATYSSMRVGLLDDRDLYRVLQGWVVKRLRERLHVEWCDAAALVGAAKFGTDYYTNPQRYQAARFKCRGWAWIDPAKEVAAYKAAVRGGFMTQGDVISATSPDKDIEDVLRERHEELAMAAELDLVFDTDPAQVNDKGAVQPGAAPSADGQGEGAEPGGTEPDTDDTAGAAGNSKE